MTRQNQKADEVKAKKVHENAANTFASANVCWSVCVGAYRAVVGPKQADLGLKSLKKVKKMAKNDQTKSKS